MAGREAAGINRGPARGVPFLLSPAILRQARRSRSVMIGAVLTLGSALLAILAPILAPHDPSTFNPMLRLAPPSATYLLGTDELGRDLLSRLLWGSQITLAITIGSVIVSVVLGTSLGILAGFRGGWSDATIMRLMDVWLAMPTFLLAVAVIAALGPSTVNVIVAVGLSSAPAFARVA